MAAAQAQVGTLRTEMQAAKRQAQADKKAAHTASVAATKREATLKSSALEMKSNFSSELSEQKAQARQAKEEHRTVLAALEAERASLEAQLETTTDIAQLAEQRLEASRLQNKWLRQHLSKFETPANTAAAASAAGIIDTPNTASPLQTW